MVYELIFKKKRNTLKTTLSSLWKLCILGPTQSSDSARMGYRPGICTCKRSSWGQSLRPHLVVVQSPSHVWLCMLPWTAASTPCPSPPPGVCPTSQFESITSLVLPSLWSSSHNSMWLLEKQFESITSLVLPSLWSSSHNSMWLLEKP